MPKRLVTLVAGLDEILYGGIPQRNAVLIGGTPGAGKSLTIRQTAMTAISLGIPTVYYTAEEHPSEVIESFKEFFNFDVWPYVRTGLLRFAYLCYSCPSSKYFTAIPLRGRREGERTRKAYELLIDDMINAARDGYKLVVIDSVTPLWADAPSMGRKIMIMIHSAIKSNHLTALITTQVSKEEEGFGGPGVEHASDGIIFMNTRYYEGELKRIIKVRKMRGTKHTLRQHEYVIGDGEVIIDWMHYVFGINKFFKKELPPGEQQAMARAVVTAYESVLREVKENEGLIQTLQAKEDDIEYLAANFKETASLIEETINEYTQLLDKHEQGEEPQEERSDEQISEKEEESEN